MLNTVFATKLDMTQAWSKQGKRLAVTRCNVQPNLVITKRQTNVLDKQDHTQTKSIFMYEIGYGTKKIKNMPKPLQSKLQQSGFSTGVRQIKGVRAKSDEIEVGNSIQLADVLEVGDVVKVQGITKGRGFAGVVKRHGFSGGPRTHGQSDRLRAPGSIGAGTDPGRVWPGMRMAGHMGVETKTVQNLTVLYTNAETGEVWLSGPVPGHIKSTVRIVKTGKKKNIELDPIASGLPQQSMETQPATEEAGQEEKKTEHTETK